MSRRGQIFELLASEDVNSDEMDLRVAMFAGLGGGHLDDLAGTLFDDHETVLPQGRTLHGVGGRGTGIGALKGMLMLSSNIISLVDFGHDPSIVALQADRSGGVGGLLTCASLSAILRVVKYTWTTVLTKTDVYAQQMCEKVEFQGRIVVWEGKSGRNEIVFWDLRGDSVKLVGNKARPDWSVSLTGLARVPVRILVHCSMDD